MKFQINKIIAITAITLVFNSCSNDNDDQTITGEGKLGVEFDNVFGSYITLSV